jgi:hypothetical protein
MVFNATFNNISVITWQLVLVFGHHLTCKLFLFLFSGCIYCFNSNLEISERESSLYCFQHDFFHIFQGIVAIAYYLGLQLPVESAPITTCANVENFHVRKFPN